MCLTSGRHVDRLRLEHVAVEWNAIPVSCRWAGEVKGAVHLGERSRLGQKREFLETEQILKMQVRLKRAVVICSRYGHCSSLPHAGSPRRLQAAPLKARNRCPRSSQVWGWILSFFKT